MKTLELTLVAREPLVITAGSAESMAHACLDYIPGNMILGALAAAFKHAHPGNPDDSPIFRLLFLNGQVSFGCAFPLCDGIQSVPVPLSFMREKSMGALPVEGSNENAAEFAVFNLLPLPPGDKQEVLRNLWLEKYGPDAPPCKFKRISATFMNPHTLRQPNLRKVWNTRVALGKQRSALESQLFGFSALAAGTHFRAKVFCHTDEAAAELKKLVEGMSWIRLGHARSAGYGLAALEGKWLEEGEEKTEKRMEHDFFLLSHYMPEPYWENPLENLLERLGDVAGAKPEPIRMAVGHDQIEGFCSHWSKPRDSRKVLAQGSVFRVKFARPVCLKSAYALGGGQLEGYGRILVNPAFVAEAMPPIPVGNVSPAPTRAVPPPISGPQLKMLRHRALIRAAKKQALTWLHASKWQKFLEDASTLSQPTASQLANFLGMDLRQFEEMLKKSPGTQWKTATAHDPFSRDSRREHLDEIMKKLLDTQVFFGAFPAEAWLLPGGEPDGEERKIFGARSHGLFKYELVRTWLKNARGRKEG